MKLQLIAKKEIALGVWEMGFDIKNRNFSFKAGQYVRMVLPYLDIEDTKGPARLFSISSSPNNKEQLDITFRLSESGYKKTLLNMAIGAEAEFEGPWGSLVLPESAEKPIVFIAGGTGITPFLSMVRFATEQKLPHRIILIYSSRDKKNIAYLSELKAIAKANSTIKICFAAGLIEQDLIRKNSPKNFDALFYISGPPAMVDYIRDTLQEVKVPEESIYYEEWSNIDFLRPQIKNMFDVSADAIFLTDLTGIIKYANPAWEILSGWKAAEVVEKHTPRIQKSGKQGPEFYKDLWEHHINGKVFKHDVVNKRRDGTFYEIDHLYLPLFSAAKQILGFAAFQREISEEKIRQKEKYEKMIMASIDGFWLINSMDGSLLDVNDAYCSMSGYSKDELLSMRIQDIEAKETEEEIRQHIKYVIKQGYDLFDSQHRKKDGTIFDVSISVVAMNGGSHYFAFIRDVTERKRLDKMKTEFISIASHQLKTPLTAISWIIERLTSGKVGKFTKKQKDYLNNAYDSNKRMVRLIDDLLSVSRLEDGKIRIEPKPLQLAELIKKIIEVHRFLMLKGKCKITFDKPKDELPLIVFDESLMRQVIGNLLTNAMRYSRNGCQIEVKLEKIARNLLLTISDKGIGIPKDKQHRVFEKFFRADNAQKLHPDGTGLGLYITKMIVGLLGGKIWFESEEGAGTTFYVELPI